MATLAELKEIHQNASLDPGDPPDPDIVAANELLGRLEAALWRIASAFLSAGPDLPAEAQSRNEAIAWAQRTMSNSRGAAEIALKLALAGAPPAWSRAQILGVTDAQVEAGLRPLIPLLARGFHPGR